MPTIDAKSDLVPAAGHVVVRVKDKSAELFSSADILAKITMLIADVVWPGWVNDPSGRETYMGYVDGCSDGELLCARKDFFDVAWPRVKEHLKVDGIIVVEVSE